MQTNEFDDLYKLTNKADKVMSFEKIIYAFADKLTDGKYNGGIWKSEVIINDEENVSWFFCLRDNDNYEVANNTLQCMSTVSSKCFSLIVFTYAINYFLTYNYEDEALCDLIIELDYISGVIRQKYSDILSEEEAKIYFQVTD